MPEVKFDEPRNTSDVSKNDAVVDRIVWHQRQQNIVSRFTHCITLLSLIIPTSIVTITTAFRLSEHIIVTSL